MSERNKRRQFDAFPVVLILLFFIVHLFYVERVSYNVPHMDTWKVLADLTEKYMQGNVTLMDWFPIPHGEYFSLLGTPINYISFYLLDLNYQVHTYLGAVFLFFESIILYRAYMIAVAGKGESVKHVYQILFVFVLLGVYNLNQWEIASFDCALGFFMRTWFYCYMFSYIDRMLHKDVKRMRSYVGGGILCVIAIIVISHAYFPGAIATVSLTMLYDYFSKRDWKSIKYYLVVALFVIGAGIVYIATYSFSQISGSTAAEEVGFWPKVLVLIKAYLIMAGAPLLHQSAMESLTPYYLVGSINILVSIICVAIYFKKKKHKISYMPLMLNMYGYISIFIIAFVRLNQFNLQYMTSSRYVVETTFILIGNMWMLIGFFADALSKVKLKKKELISAGISGALLLTVGLGIVASDRIEWGIAPYRKALFKQMAYNMLNIDYVSDEALAIAQAPASDVREAVEVLKKYELSVFHELPNSEELQKMQIDTMDPYEYKCHSGVYSDGWVGPHALLYVKSGMETEITLHGNYPFAIAGNEKITVRVDDTVTEYYIHNAEFSIPISVPPNSMATVSIECDFYTIVSPDDRELCFMLVGIDGYAQQK